MADFNSMYKKLFNAITDAVNILQQAQIETEGMYIDHNPTPVKFVTPKGDDEDGGGNDA